ncbi:hypothetical protein EB796_018032 [Bugula neritina]|uniref:BHLH domain-containing protein n=1 Tax=Bugula neritina TaxID=10212 RepID=A0A7J7JC67_BUGNE|nr:hypothetical protein EB796_018032 [Bugula neritina]
MKATYFVTAPSARSIDLSRVHRESGKVRKSTHHDAKMQEAELYFKLKELVPTCSETDQLSKTQLLQNVIDYIFDLEDTLELNITRDDQISESKSPFSAVLPLSESFTCNNQTHEQMDVKDGLRKV